MTGGAFPETRWSIVLRSRDDAPAVRSALEHLCAAYWYPVYAFVRRAGHPAHDAEDLVQSFFARLLEKRDLHADPARGRFRCYLTGALRHFLANAADRDQANKRGGRVRFVAMHDSEVRFQAEPADHATPELLFERSMALDLLDGAMNALAAEQGRAGKGALFQRLAPFLGADAGTPPYAQLAADLAASEGALRVALHRLRQRYGELVRLAVADLVADPADIDAEVQALLAALAR
jgi:RNA polymerase sigma-70 factor (ECF subfamily)